MGRIATVARGIAIFLLAGVVTIGVLFYIAANYSEITNEFTCEGETKFADLPAEVDKGRLKISEYRWWVSLWSDNTDGIATFQSTKIPYFYELKLDRSGDGNFSTYAGLSKNKGFVFRHATGELGFQQAGMTFTGECTPAQ